MRRLRNYLTEPVEVGRWFLWLVLIAVVLDMIANENWVGLALTITAFIVTTAVATIRRHQAHP